MVLCPQHKTQSDEVGIGKEPLLRLCLMQFICRFINPTIRSYFHIIIHPLSTDVSFVYLPILSPILPHIRLPFLSLIYPGLLPSSHPSFRLSTQCSAAVQVSFMHKSAEN
jgi:hypothetical protein